jgi:hypothetical protein
MLKEQMKIVEEGGEPTIGIFRDVVENECLPTTVHAEEKPAFGQVTRASLSGNIGGRHAAIKELEEAFSAAASAVAVGAR